MSKVIKNNLACILICLIVIACIYAILTIKLNLFWRFGLSEKADNINEIIVNLSYSVLAGAIFYLFVDIIPFCIKRKKMRMVILTKLNKLKGSIHKAKTAIYLPPFSKMPNAKEKFIEDFNCKDMNDAYQLGVDGFKNIKEFFFYNKMEIQTLIQDILNYSSFLTQTELETLAMVNTSKYVNDFFFMKDFEMLKIRPDLYDNQKEIGESIFMIEELMSKIETRNKTKAL